MKNGRGNGSGHAQQARLQSDPLFERMIRAALEHQDVDRLAQEFCVILAEAFGGLCNIVLLNQHNEMMHIAGLHDYDPEALAKIEDMVAATADMPRDEGVAAITMRSGEPLLVKTIPPEQTQAVTNPAMRRYIEEVGVETLMAVPLKGRTGIFGAVAVTRHRGGAPFEEADLDLLKALSLRVSLGLENLLLVHSLRQQVAAASERESRAGQAEQDLTDGAQAVRLRAVFDRIMKANLEHGENADRLARELCKITAETIGDLCMIVLTNPHSEILHIAGMHDVDPTVQSLLAGLMGPTGFLPRKGSQVAPVARSGQAVLRKSISDEELRSFVTPEFGPFLEQVGIESLAAVPLQGRGGSVGAVSIYRHKGGKPYEEADLELLRQMALRMQVALENLLLVESLQARADGSGPAAGPAKSYLDLTDAERLAVLHRMTHMIGDHRDRPDRMMELAAVMTAEALGGVAGITLLNRHNELMHIAAYYDADARARALIGDVLRATENMPRDTGLVGQALRAGEPLLVPSVDEGQFKQMDVPALAKYIEEVGVSSMMAAPLRGATGIVGGISVSRHRGDRPFTEADRDFLVEIAYRLALGVENQQLIDSLRKEAANSSSTQMALHASEERFRSVFDSAALGIEIMDAAGLVVDVNPAFESMTGFSRADVIGRYFGVLQHPDESPVIQRMLTELKMNRQPEEPLENRIIRRDGSILWVRTHLAPVKKQEDGAISFIVALHENISGRKQAERYFEAVLEATPDALVMVESEGRIMLVNRQMEKLFGYDRNEVLGKEVEMLIPERLRGRHPLHRTDYLSEPHVRPMGESLELFAVAKDGREIPVEISLSPLQMENAVVVVAAIRDITERKQRQAALVRSERSLSEAQRLAHLGSLEYDLITGGLEASDEALRILGMAREELGGSDTVLARMHPDDRDRVRERTQAVLKSRVPEEIEFRVVLPDGTVRIVHDRVAPFFSPQGAPTRILGTVQDVTEQRQAEKEMAELKNHLQSSVELERLRLAQDLHDGPMQELYGASYRLEELREGADLALSVALQEVSEDIQGTIGELRSIAKELRPPAISNFGLEKAIRSYVEDFQAKYPNIHLRLSLAKDHQLLPETTRLTLFRVFQQALTNVVRHAQASEVLVRFTLDAEEARLVISDNGAGFQVPPSWMSFARQGHYGLAGAAERINALGGLLLVDSAPHHSTTVTAVVPWSRRTEEPGMPQLEH